MRNFVLALAACVALFNAPAMAASVTGEYKMIDNAAGSNADEFKLEYGDTVGRFVNLGAEITTKQEEHQGGLGSKLAVKAGPVLPTILGFKPVAYVEAGRSLSEGNDYNFYGVGGKVSHAVYGPVDANVGYRYRKAVDADDLVENRYNVGLSAKVADELSIGTNYYWTKGTTESEAVGLSLTRNF